MGTYLDKETELEDRIERLEQRVNDLETVGKPKYGIKHESAVLHLPVVMPPLLDFDFKQLRKAKGLTLREVQKETGISNAYLSQLETGKIKSPSYMTVKTLLDLYRNGV